MRTGWFKEVRVKSTAAHLLRALLYLRERFLSDRLWPSYHDILDAYCAAWNALVEEC